MNRGQNDPRQLMRVIEDLEIGLRDWCSAAFDAFLEAAFTLAQGGETVRRTEQRAWQVRSQAEEDRHQVDNMAAYVARSLNYAKEAVASADWTAKEVL